MAQVLINTLFVRLPASYLLGIALVIILISLFKIVSRKTNGSSSSANIGLFDIDGGQEIEPLKNFEWSKTEPVKQRPFKPIWHMTMGLQDVPPSEYIQIDKDYLERIRMRQRIIEDYSDTVIAFNDAAQPAIREFYTWLMTKYLPSRFPTMFILLHSEQKDGKSCPKLQNTVTGAIHPTQPPQDLRQALSILGEMVEEDFMFLVPSGQGDSTTFSLQGVVACFPSSWSPKEKCGMSLRDIHAPVPRYKEKMAMSLDRVLSKLKKPGKIYMRQNWAVTTSNNLFAPGGQFHLYEDNQVEEETVEISTTCVRSERQSFRFLPESKTIVFSFHSYQYPLSQIKEEGLGEVLAEAIDGLKKGSVPEIHYYKRAPIWAEQVKSYLRS
ncbi:hypothetical protein N7495_003706 [Penicillium taxi]|uniref:uncharacterized protein n=1 Tax=Penicillium taxi TaxID=168475 RepID=UPI002545A5EE|nr:uncharacterized protein N7495_003706 [Penicillium taxi]KAJ5898962.1 hypothetical protein N7495_003706 [Penicillium taxi]